MNKFDIVFGQNWIDQFQRGIQHTTCWGHLQDSATQAIRMGDDLGKIMSHAFVWDDTPQGWNVWNERKEVLHTLSSFLKYRPPYLIY